MGSVINSFEVVESIRFLAQIVATEGVSQKAKDKANEYIEKLVDCLSTSVQNTTATVSGITLK